MKLAIRIAAALVAAAFALPAFGQSYSGQINSGSFYGNPNATAGKPQGASGSSMFDRAFGSTRGSILERGAGGWSPIAPSATPGLPWVGNGTGVDPAYQALGNSGLAQMPANTIKCNPAGSSGNAQDCAMQFYGLNLVGDGVTDNCSAITALNAVIAAQPGATYDVRPIPGTYVVNCNITLSGVWHFTKGAILKPGNGFTVTFANIPDAGAWQIFNLYTASTGTATGGNIAFPTKSYSYINGEWFGMIGDNSTLHNEVGLQLAINSIYPAGGANGGQVNLGTGVFLMCGHYTAPNAVAIQGMGRNGTELLANSGCWNGDANMLVSINTGNIAQFGCWHRDLQINAGSIAAITAVVNAGSWQEDSGFERVLLNNFMAKGITDTGFYGGAATINVIDTEIFASASATGSVFGVWLQSPSTQNWANLNLNRVTWSANKTPLGNEVGFGIFGRINVNANSVHLEQEAFGFDLNDRATLSGSGINGGPQSGTLVAIDTQPNPQNANEANTSGSATLMSRVNVQGLVLGGGTSILQDFVNTITISDQFGLPFSYPSQSVYNGAKPTCGTGCTSVTGTNQKFNAVTGTSVTSVTINFNPPFASTPTMCVGNTTYSASVYILALSASAVTFGLSSAGTTQNVFGNCQQ